MAGGGPGRSFDAESATWVGRLHGAAPDREAGVRDLHELLLRAARREVRRRAGEARINGRELDDIALQAADDATCAVLAKVDAFRGESRFTTWAYRFVVLEVSHKVGRHFWRQPRATLSEEAWDRLPDLLAARPDQVAEVADLTRAFRQAVDGLTEHQRTIFRAVVLEGVPLEALALQLDTNRNALYKAMFDARRKIRTHLVANGYLVDEAREEVPDRD
jgi:RNA polymerase sigma-70 factor (ECF subfamily)